MKQIVRVSIVDSLEGNRLSYECVQTHDGFMCPMWHADGKVHYLNTRRVGAKCCDDKHCGAILARVIEQVLTCREIKR